MCIIADDKFTREVLERLTRIETKLENDHAAQSEHKQVDYDHEQRLRKLENEQQATNQTVQALKRFLWVIGGGLVAVVIDLAMEILR
jgi:chromosome segregation ATPase